MIYTIKSDAEYVHRMLIESESMEQRADCMTEQELNNIIIINR